MSDVEAKMHKIPISAGAPQIPSLYLRGPTSKGRAGKRGRGEGEGGEEGKGRERKRRES